MGTYPDLNGIIVWMLISGFIPLLFAINASKLRKSNEVRYFVYLMIFSAVYSCCYALELLSIPMPQKVFFLKLQYLGAVFFGPVLFLLVWNYSGRDDSVLMRRLIFVIPVLNLLLVLTNGMHHLFYTSYSTLYNGAMGILVTSKGPLYWLHQAYTALLLLTSQFFLLRMFVSGTVTDVRQVYFVWFGAIFPIIAYFVHLIGIVPYTLDPIPISFIGTGIFVYWGLAKYRLFKEAPIAYRALFESIADGVLVVDRMEGIVSFNPAVSAMVTKFGSKAEKQEAIQSIWNTIKAGIGPENPHHQPKFRWEGSGSSRWYSASVSPIMRVNEFLGKIVVIRDITTEVESVKALEAAKVEAEQANLAKSEFLANMSHEIRTPLNGVIGFTELLGNTVLSEQQKRYVTTAFTSANVLLDLINNVLDLSKIEAGKMELDIQEVNLRHLIRGIADVLSFQAAKDNIQFILSIAPEVPYLFMGDEVKIKQVLINLLSNAFKFTHNGEVQLRIWVVERVGNTVRLGFEVRDTGIGIPKEKQQMIFEAFSQADTSTTKKYGGTGLGLTISNKLLHLMQSKLTLESQPGKGSVFSFELPDMLLVQESPFLDTAFAHYSPALLVGFEGGLGETLRYYLGHLSIESTSLAFDEDALDWLRKHPEVHSIFFHVVKNQKGEFPQELGDFIGRLPHAMRSKCCLVFPADTPEAIFTRSEALGCKRKLIKPFMLMDLVHQFEKWTVADGTVSPRDSISRDIPTTKKLKVLVAEDNAVNRMLVKVYLSNFFPAFEVIEAENGKDAFDYYKRENPDLLITDLHMPELNGYELAKKIRSEETSKRIPILALTANVLDGQEEECKQAGIDDYITKPVRQETFRNVLEKWVG